MSISIARFALVCLLTLVGSLQATAALAETSAPASPGQAGVLNVTGSLWSPYLDGDLENGGLAADLVRSALVRAGYEVHADVEGWTRAYEGTAVGVYDAVAAIWQSEWRGHDLLFSSAYLMNDIVFLARRDVAVDYERLSDLRGLRIGVVREYAYEDAFDQDPGLTRVVSEHLVQNLLLLRQGRIDIVVGDKWAILHQISQFIPDDVGSFKLLSKPLARRALRLGVSRKNPKAEQIVADFDKAIQEMREDGSYAEIVRRHTAGIALLPKTR